LGQVGTAGREGGIIIRTNFRGQIPRRYKGGEGPRENEEIKKLGACGRVVGDRKKGKNGAQGKNPCCGGGATSGGARREGTVKLQDQSVHRCGAVTGGESGPEAMKQKKQIGTSKRKGGLGEKGETFLKGEPRVKGRGRGGGRIKPLSLTKALRKEKGETKRTVGKGERQKSLLKKKKEPKKEGRRGLLQKRDASKKLDIQLKKELGGG